MCEKLPNMTSPWARVGASLPDVEPYVPFNINPTGMQPVLTTTYLMALPSLVAKYGFSVSLPFTWFII
jgi:preprotein translocase subunit SecY